MTASEDLKMVFDSKANSSRLYFIILLFLLTFFILVPVWKIGYQGLILWVVWVIFLIFSLAQAIMDRNNFYLLTNQRIIHLKLFYKNDFRLVGFIKLADIKAVYKKRKNIYILSGGRKYVLVALNSADKLYRSLDSYLKSQNLV